MLEELNAMLEELNAHLFGLADHGRYMWDMVRGWVLLLLVSAVLFVGADAEAVYTEAHVTGVDARFVVGRDGHVVVTHSVGYRVLAGALRSIALTGFEDDWRFHPTAVVTSSDAHTFGGSVSRDDKGIVHITLDDPKGLKRGDYEFELTYEGALGARVSRDGAFDRVRFALPLMHEGTDSVRVSVDLPAAPTEPRAITEGDNAADLSTLRRGGERDVLELVRPHVPKGDVAAFVVRVDPKALSQLDLPKRASVAPVVEEESPRPRLGVALLVSVSALVVFALGLGKGRLLARSGKALTRGLLPGDASLRAALAAIPFAGGVYAETQGRMLVSALLVAASLPWLAWRMPAAPAVVLRARSRGTWLVVKPEEAFVRRASRADLLDATTLAGLAVLGTLVVWVAMACWLVRAQASGGAAYWVAIDAFVLAPVFFTGTSRQLPPSAAQEGIALAPVARVLGAQDDLRVSPLACTDEMRLLVSPRLAMTGVAAIEVGVAWERAGGAMLPSFDVLIRVYDDSFAAAKMTAHFGHKKVLPGRKPEERVYRFEPEWPSAVSAAAMVVHLADVVRDRRLVIPAAFEGAERRLPLKRAATKGASLA